MSPFIPTVALLLQIVMFVTVVFSHLVRKNSTAVTLYAVQSGAVVLLLMLGSFTNLTLLSFIAILATFVVKVCVAPYFLSKLINTNQLKFSSSTYLSNPLTLLVLGGIVALTQSSYLQPLTTIAPQGTGILIAMAVILGSLFLVINRKGALSQMLGILSIENGIVAFALAAGLEQSPALQIGITFDIFIWIWVATVFIGMMYRQFGSLDVSTMRHLTEK